MIIPMTWLRDYVSVPAPVTELTHRLTMIGHMLDKEYEVDGETVIDLELRGNRSDLFGVFGMAREVAAAFSTSLSVPHTLPIPTIDPSSRLVVVEAPDLVERFLAFELDVDVGPSPEWIIERLALYGIPSVNNVVDITNYCMIETGEPMHAYDADKLSGGRLILRRAKIGEEMTTLLGKQAVLSCEDLAICDEEGPQAIALIGSQKSAVTKSTQRILLEAAVYKQANVRRSARRLNIYTEAGTRHEKLLDPSQVVFALERALFLLREHANAQLVGPACDFYPNPIEPKRIKVPINDVLRLTGTDVPRQGAKEILSRLGCQVQDTDSALYVTVPTFRTDIEQSADIVEEIIRIYGYDRIPSISLSGSVPQPATSPMYSLKERVRDLMVLMQCDEVILSPLIQNDAVKLYEQEGEFDAPIVIENAPNSLAATLRFSMLPGLVEHAYRCIRSRQQRVAFFEIGKVYILSKDEECSEQTRIGLVLSGEVVTRAWSRNPRSMDVFDLKGVIEGLCSGLGIEYRVELSNLHPSISPTVQGAFYSDDDRRFGEFGQLHEVITGALGIDHPLFVAELSLDTILQLPKSMPRSSYVMPVHPPTIRDMSFVVSTDFQVGHFIRTLKQADPLITDVSLLDVYEENRTVRITYAHPGRTLSAEDVEPVRERVIQLARDRFDADLRG